MIIRHRIGARIAVAVTAAVVVLVGMSGSVPARANPNHIDPAELDRGADPGVAYLVGDTIHDGHRRVAATRLGEHHDLWTTFRGYVLDDFVQSREVFRLVFVSHGGQKRVIARRSWPTGEAISPNGRRIAWGQAMGRLGPPTMVKVGNPNSGRVLASRRFDFATVFGVTRSRVLLTLRDKHAETTWWWNYERDTLSLVSSQPARRADLRHDRIVLGTGPEDSFCNRVAPLSVPEQTLWASCGIGPRRWSPDGARALATHTYFDESGTDRWLTTRDRTGQRLGHVNGRLDWDSTWEDNHHFLTVAQSGKKAAIIRCTVGGRCERASSLWGVAWNGYPPYYVAPPVVLPDN